MKLSFLTLSKACAWIYGTFIIPQNWEVLFKQFDLGALLIDNTCVIAIRGTSTLSDVIVDIDAFIGKGSCENSNFNDVFLKHYHMFFRKRIIDFLSENDDKCHRNNTIFTGHSLGGSIATIASFDNDYQDVITMGEPRTCCDKISNKSHLKSHIRIINGYKNKEYFHDPIPSINGIDNNVHCESKVIWTNNLFNFDTRKNVPLKGKILYSNMHHIQNYIKKLKINELIQNY